MNLIENLVDFFKKPKEATQESAPTGLCPVCWGYQEYDQKIRTLFKDKQVDVNNHRDRYLLIQAFVVHHVDGITLKEGSIDTCPTCGEAENSQ